MADALCNAGIRNTGHKESPKQKGAVYSPKAQEGNSKAHFLIALKREGALL